MEKRRHFIPQDLVINILLRLPLKSLFRFKAVCKSWNILIISSSFVDARDARHAAAGKILWFYERNEDEPQTPVLALLDPSREPKITFLDWPPFQYKPVFSFDNQFKRVRDKLKLGVSVIGPVHGIYCIYNKQRRWIDMVTLWNPATGHYKHITLPVFPLPSESPTYITCKGVRFGFDSSSNDFKLVLMCCWYDDGEQHIFKVYDMSTNSWKNKHHLDHRDPNCYLQEMLVSGEGVGPVGDGCFVNGACHFPCHWRERNVIQRWHRGALAFDLATESFQVIKGPPNTYHCHQEFSRWQDNQSLAMIVLRKLPSPHHEVWVMTEYGVEDSWVKLYSIELGGPIRSLGIPKGVLLLFHVGRQVVGSSILARAFKVQGLPPPTYSDRERDIGVLKYEETLVGASIFNRHCSTETTKRIFAGCKRLCTRAPSGMLSGKKKET